MDSGKTLKFIDDDILEALNPYQQEVALDVVSSASKYGVDPALALGVAFQESRLGEHSVSPAGALGVMQLMPATAADLGVSDAMDNRQNIDGGVRYLRQLLDRYDGDRSKALAAYNWGMGNVDRLGLDKMPGETRDYLSKVPRHADRFQKSISQYLPSPGSPTGVSPRSPSPVSPPNPAPRLSARVSAPASSSGYYPLRLPDGSRIEVREGVSVVDALAEARQKFPGSFPPVFEMRASGKDGDSSPWDAFLATTARTTTGLFPGLRAAYASAIGDEEGYDAAQRDIEEASLWAAEIAPSLTSIDDIKKAWNEEGVGSAVGKAFEFGAETVGSSFGYQAPSALAALGGYGLAAAGLAGGVSAPVLATLAGLGAMYATFLSSDIERAHAEGAIDTEDVNTLGIMAAAGGQTALNSLSYLLVGGSGALRALTGSGLSREGRDLAVASFGKVLNKLDKMHPVKQAAAVLLEEEVAEVGQQALERMAAGLPVSPADEQARDEYTEVMLATIFPGVGFGAGRGGVSALRTAMERSAEGEYTKIKALSGESGSLARRNYELAQRQSAESFQELSSAIEDETQLLLEQEREQEEGASLRYEAARRQAEIDLRGEARSGREALRSRAARARRKVAALQNVTAADIEETARSRNISFDNDPEFMVWMSQVTGPDGNPIGKYEIDRLNENERRSVLSVLEALPVQGAESKFAGATEAMAEGVFRSAIGARKREGAPLNIKKFLKIPRNLDADTRDGIIKNYFLKMKEMGLVKEVDGKFYPNHELSGALEEQYEKVRPLIVDGEFPSVEEVKAQTDITDDGVIESLRIASVARNDVFYTPSALRDRGYYLSEDGQVDYSTEYPTLEAARDAASRILDRDTKPIAAFEIERRMPERSRATVPDRDIGVVESSPADTTVSDREYTISSRPTGAWEVLDADGNRVALRSSKKKAQSFIDGAGGGRVDVIINGEKVSSAKSRTEAQKRRAEWIREKKAKAYERAYQESMAETELAAPAARRDRRLVPPRFREMQDREAARKRAARSRARAKKAEAAGKKAAADVDNQYKTQYKFVPSQYTLQKSDGFTVTESRIDPDGRKSDPRITEVFATEGDARSYIDAQREAVEGPRFFRGQEVTSPRRRREIESVRRDPELAIAQRSARIPARERAAIEIAALPEERLEAIAAERAAAAVLGETGASPVGPAVAGASPEWRASRVADRAEESVIARLDELVEGVDAGRIVLDPESDLGKKYERLKLRQETKDILLAEAAIDQPGDRAEWISDLESAVRSAASGMGLPVRLDLYAKQDGQESGAEFLTEAMVIKIAVDADLEGKTFQEQLEAIQPYLNHEFIHVSRRLGLIKESEWKNLTKFVEKTEIPANVLAKINSRQRDAGARELPSGTTYLEMAKIFYARQGSRAQEKELARLSLNNGEITRDEYESTLRELSRIEWIPDDYVEEAVARAFQVYTEEGLLNLPEANRNAPEVEKNVFKRILNWFRRVGSAIKKKGNPSVEDLFSTFATRGELKKRLDRGKALDTWWLRRSGHPEFRRLKQFALENNQDFRDPREIDEAIFAQARAEDEGHGSVGEEGRSSLEFAEDWITDFSKTSPETRKANELGLDGIEGAAQEARSSLDVGREELDNYNPDSRKYDEPLPKKVKAWHGGSRQLGDPWKPRDSYGKGTGEGWVGGGPLGMGAYFSTKRDTAKKFLKYGGDSPQLSEVVIDTSNMVNTLSDSPKWKKFREGIEKNIESRLVRRGLKPEYISQHDLFKEFPPDIAYKILDDAGITGFYTQIPAGDEIVVFDPSVISDPSMAGSQETRRSLEVPEVYVRADEVEVRNPGLRDEYLQGPDRQLPGKLVRKGDLPETLYHVSGRADAITDSGVLRGSLPEDFGSGGLGGPGYSMVSLTANPNIAEMIRTELVRFGEISRGVEDFRGWLEGVASEDARKSGVSPSEASGWVEGALKGIDASSRREAYRNMEAFKSYLAHRGSTSTLRKIRKWDGYDSVSASLENPVVFGTDPEVFSDFTEETVRILPVSRDLIPDEAAIRSIDHLEEIAVHADLVVDPSRVRGSQETRRSLDVGINDPVLAPPSADPRGLKAKGVPGDLDSYTWGEIDVDRFGKRGRPTRVIVKEGYTRSIPGTDVLTGMGKSFLESSNPDVQRNTTFSNWEDLVAGAMNRIDSRSIERGEFTVSRENDDRVVLIWDDPRFEEPASITLDYVKDRTSDASGNPDNDYWSVVGLRADGGYSTPQGPDQAIQELRGPNVSATAVLAAERPDLLDPMSPREERRYSLDRSTANLTPEQRAAVDVVMGGLPNTRRTLWEKATAGLPKINKSWIDWFRRVFLDKYNDLRKAELLLVAEGRDGDYELARLADTSAHAAALMVDRAAPFYARMLSTGGIEFQRPASALGDPDNFDGTTRVKALPLVNEASGVVVGFDPNDLSKHRTIDVSLTPEEGYKNQTGGLIPILQLIGRPSKNLTWEFFAYARSLRALRLKSEGRAGDAEWSDAVIAQNLDLARQYPEIGIVHKNLQNWNDTLVDFLVDTGSISQDMAESWKRYGDYTPFYRDMANMQGTGSASDVSSELLSLFGNEFGSERVPLANSLATGSLPQELKRAVEQEKMLDPFEAISKNAMKLVTFGLKNVARNRALRDQQAIGMMNPREDGSNGIAYQLTGPNNTAVKTIRNGEVQYWYVADPAMQEVLSGSFLGNNPGTAWASRLFSIPANILREGVTRSPDFIIRNLIRDSVNSWMLGLDAPDSPFGAPLIGTLKRYGRNLRLQMKGQETPEYATISDYGAVGGHELIGVSPRKLRRIFRSKVAQDDSKRQKFMNFWDAWGEASGRSEAAVREQVYKQVLKSTEERLRNKGYTDSSEIERIAMSEAAFQAMEVLNFGRRGSSQILGLFTSGIPFLNARMQGLDRLGRAYVQKESVDSAIAPEQFKRIFRNRFLMLAAASGLLQWFNYGDEDYEDLRKEQRDDNWMIMLPGWGDPNDPRFISLPIPFELGIMAKVIPEQITRALLKYADGRSGRDISGELLETAQRSAMSTLSFNPIPQAFLPMFETYMNHDIFTDRSIVPYWLEQVDPEYQKRVDTGSFVSGVGSLLGMSPLKFEHLIEGYFGTLGMYGMAFTDFVIDRMTPFGKESAPAMSIARYPVLRSVLKPGTGGGQKAYYYEEIANEVDRVVGTLNRIREERDPEAYADYLKENMEIFGYRGRVKYVDKALRNLRKRRDAVIRSDLGPGEKTDELEKIRVIERNLLSGLEWN